MFPKQAGQHGKRGGDQANRSIVQTAEIWIFLHNKVLKEKIKITQVQEIYPGPGSDKFNNNYMVVFTNDLLP